MIQVTTERDDVLSIDVSFDSVVVDQLQMRRLLHQLEHVMTQLQERKSAALEEIEVLSPQDRQEILDWNQGPTMCPTIKSCIHSVIQNRVLQNPNAVAVASWEGDLSYLRLDRLSTQLAHELISCNIGPEVIVPLYFEKSYWTVVGESILPIKCWKTLLTYFRGSSYLENGRGIRSP